MFERPVEILASKRVCGQRTVMVLGRSWGGGIAVVRKMTTVLRAVVQPCRHLLFEHRNSLSAKMCGQPPKFGRWCYILNYPMSTSPQHPGLFPNLIKLRILHVCQGTCMGFVAFDVNPLLVVDVVVSRAVGTSGLELTN